MSAAEEEQDASSPKEVSCADDVGDTLKSKNHGEVPTLLVVELAASVGLLWDFYSALRMFVSVFVSHVS